MSARALTEEEARAVGLLDKPREIRISRAPDAITRRLALAALRLAVFAIGTRTLSARIFGSREFATLATWSGASIGDEATRATNAAIFEAVAALREAGEVSE